MPYSLCLFSFLIAAALFAQTPPADTLVFTNGEKLIGKLLRSNGATVTFKSDSIGEVNVPWGKIAELHSAQNFAVIREGIKLDRKAAATAVPQGAVSATNQTITVAPAGKPAEAVPVAEAAHLIDQPTFEKDFLHDPPLLRAWTGGITAGVTLVQATQESRTYSGSIHLVRSIPEENWLDARNRTILNFAASKGSVVQPNTPRLKTEILHADAERDQYFTNSHVFGFAHAGFDHNFSQGLDLQQNYGGGIGWTVIKQANATLDIKGSVAYTRQNFNAGAASQDLIGSVFAESYMRKFARGILFLQEIAVTPEWNVTSAYAAIGTTSLNVPVYKRMTFTTSISDSFLNNPPPGFKKNSFQFLTGLTYLLR